MLRSVIEIDGRKADIDLMRESILPDLASSERAKIALSSGKCLKVSIEASDATSLRAVLNTVLRQIKMVEDMLKTGESDGK